MSWQLYTTHELDKIFSPQNWKKLRRKLQNGHYLQQIYNVLIDEDPLNKKAKGRRYDISEAIIIFYGYIAPSLSEDPAIKEHIENNKILYESMMASVVQEY